MVLRLNWVDFDAQMASQAVLAALYARDVQGSGGQHIDLSMYDAHIAFNWIDIFNDYYFANDGVTHEPSTIPGLSYQVALPLDYRYTTVRLY